MNAPKVKIRAYRFQVIAGQTYTEQHWNIEKPFRMYGLVLEEPTGTVTSIRIGNVENLAIEDCPADVFAPPYRESKKRCFTVEELLTILKKEEWTFNERMTNPERPSLLFASADRGQGILVIVRGTFKDGFIWGTELCEG
jgi:hypothetical protein